MSRFGLDYTGRVSPAAHHAVGSSFACRYLSTDPAKNLTGTEAEGLRANHIDVVTVWETTATRWLEGEAAGTSDAMAARIQASSLQKPLRAPIYFAVDFDERPDQTAALDAYFTGLVRVLGVERVGVYGDFYVCNRLADAGLVHYCWQTYAWSGGQVSKHANLLQYSNGHRVAGTDVDYNRALAEDFGQWDYRRPDPQPKPAEVADPQGVWHFTGHVDMATGEWTVEGATGQDVKMGEHPRRWEARVSVDERHGDWTIEGLPFQEV